MSTQTKRREGTLSAIPGGYSPCRSEACLRREAEKRGGAPLPEKAPRETALDRTGLPCGSAINSHAWQDWKDAEAGERLTAVLPGTRRLRDLPREIQRPLEARLYHLRRVHRQEDDQISHLLDLHPDDLAALASTHGQP